jgi:prepilin-type N-terminal cleavage/methylation domain-containing protein
VRPNGFTLIEMMAVAALLGLLAAATVWSLGDDVLRSSRRRVVAAVGHADRLARLAGRRFGKQCVLRFDLDKQQIGRLLPGDQDDTAAGHMLRLPPDYRIGRVMIARTTAGLDDLGLAWVAVDSGSADIVCSTAGRSVSYAVRLAFPGGAGGQDAGDELAGGEIWLVFSGLTGEMTLIHDEDAVDNLFSLLATGRPDAD